MNDAQYPWLILVPRVSEVTELFQLDKSQREQLDAESTILGKSLMGLFGGDKLNVAALGNVVSQLHIHHIVRYQTDPAWPAPVWGKLPGVPYTAQELELVIPQLAAITDYSW